MQPCPVQVDPRRPLTLLLLTKCLTARPSHPSTWALWCEARPREPSWQDVVKSTHNGSQVASPCQWRVLDVMVGNKAAICCCPPTSGRGFQGSHRVADHVLV